MLLLLLLLLLVVHSVCRHHARTWMGAAAD